MELDWVDKSQKSGRQAIPVGFAVMAGFCGIFLPLTDAMYVPAFIAAAIFALATPLALIAGGTPRLAQAKPGLSLAVHSKYLHGSMCARNKWHVDVLREPCRSSR